MGNRVERAGVAVMLLVAALCGTGKGVVAGEGKVVLQDVRLRPDGTLEMSVQIALKRTSTLFSWNGDLYPLLGYGLFLEARGISIKASPVKKFMPIIVRRSQIVRAKVYTYPEVLLVQLTPRSGDKLPQCITLRIIYDTTRLRGAPVELKRMRIESNWITVCQEGSS